MSTITVYYFAEELDAEIRDFGFQSEHVMEGMYDEYLDDVYGTVSIAGGDYDTARTLKTLDPIAYREGFLSYVNEYDQIEIPWDVYYDGSDGNNDDVIAEYIKTFAPVHNG